MKTLQKSFEEALSLAICISFPELSLEERKAEVLPCQQEGLGHYQCNSAMRLGKLLKKSPREVAGAILLHLPSFLTSSCEKIEIAGPGFINFTLSSSFLSRELQRILKDPFLGAVPVASKKKVIVEFSSPNIAKELHVGHLRSTIIGDSLARVFEFLGYDVLRLNHLGDWGTQFGMLITYLKEEEAGVLLGEKVVDLHQLMCFYKASKVRFDEDLEFKKRSQSEVVRLQRGEPDAVSAWKLICDLSRLGFQEIYDLLDISIIERGESFYNPYLKEVVHELEEKGLITLSEGAKCIFFEGILNRDGKPFPLMVQKSDGGYNYDTTDMAALRYRLLEDCAERIVVVTDSGQSLHFQLVFEAGRRAGWYDPKKVRLDHVPFGLVVGADGKKFKTRSGDTEKLIDLITAAISRAKSLALEKNPDMPEEELNVLAHHLGVGAIKYADLSCNRVKDYMFSYERMLRFEGNTAVFLLYSYVRILGIFRKVGISLEDAKHKATIVINHPSEIALGLHLLRFAETLDLVLEELLPNRLTDYLFELAEKFNAFFRDCRVEGTPEEASRLLLCEVASKVLRQGLTLLGLRVVDRM